VRTARNSQSCLPIDPRHPTIDHPLGDPRDQDEQTITGGPDLTVIASKKIELDRPKSTCASAHTPDG
jgi:hypothetical protein